MITTVIKRALLTERSTRAKEQQNRYTFEVALEATKHQIREAIEELFKVDVISVRTSVVPGKLRRMGAHAGYRSDWKKALVKIKQGQEIKVAEQ